MHYEIFQYFTYKDSLNLRGVSLTGYQLATNLALRKKYFREDWVRSLTKDMSKIIDNNNIFVIERIARVKFLVLKMEEIGEINFSCSNLRGTKMGIYIISKIIEQLPSLHTLFLSNIYIIFIGNNHFENIQIDLLANSFQFISNLQHLILCKFICI